MRARALCGHSGMSILIDVMTVPWAAFKGIGKLRFRLESSSTPPIPYDTSPAPISSSSIFQQQRTPSKSPTPTILNQSPLYMSSKSPAACFPPPRAEMNSYDGASTGACFSPLHKSCLPLVAASVDGSSHVAALSGAALYLHLSSKSPVSGEATAARWGLTVDVAGFGACKVCSETYSDLG